MSALATFTFNGITMRPADPRKDSKLAREWTLADPYHRDTTPPGFWVYQDLYTESYVLEDRFGAIFFFRMDWIEDGRKGRAAEFHIQFPPSFERTDKRNEQKSRIMRAMILCFEWMKRILAPSHVNEVFFLSKSPHLIRFAEKHLGFEERAGKLVYSFSHANLNGNSREES